jgi:SAM-dependent methyltransferase
MDAWTSGDAYEPYVGRWSRLVATEFVRWLALPPGLRWVDVGCGTGALTATILRDAAPSSVVGVDPSEAFLGHARAHVAGATFVVGDALSLPVDDADVVVSGLSLNFVPDTAAAVREASRVAPVVAAYVWDYAEGMAFLRHFWDAAGRPDLDEGNRFPLCRPDALREAFAPLRDVEVTGITVPTTFPDFDDYWTPFLGGVGPAPAFLATLDGAERDALRERLRATLPIEPDGSIRLTARAWAVRGLT